MRIIGQPSSHDPQVGARQNPTHPYLRAKLVSTEEIYILHLMYKDLADRTVERKINL